MSKPKKRFYKDMNYQNKRALWGFIFLLPWIIGVLVFFLGPLVKTFYYSLFEMSLETNGFSFKFVGTENFKYALRVDPEFNKIMISALLNTLQTVPIQIFVSLFVAMLLVGEYKGQGFFRLIFFAPIILATGITSIQVADVSVAAESSQSFVDIKAVLAIFESSGIPMSVLSYIVAFVNNIFEVLTTSGVQMLIFMAGLQSISPTLYEVAKIEGCTKFEVFCKITLPMISPMILVCLVYSLADSFARADITDTISKTTFSNAQYGLGAAMSLIYFIVSLVIILLCSWVVSKGVFYYDK